MGITLLLHGKHQGTHVTYEPFGPWLVPWRIADFDAAYTALRSGAGLVDYSTQALIHVEGADRVSFLHNLLTHDLKRLTPGAGCRAALLTPAAKVIAELLVIADPDALWLLCDLTRAEVVMRTLDRYHFTEQVTLTNHERRLAVLALQGPRTLECLTHLVGTTVSLPNAGDHTLLTLQGTTVRVIRHSLTGGLGVLCLVEAVEAERVWEGIRRQGAPCGLTLAGWEALNTARIEAGIPWYGIDLDDSILLPETGLETIVASDTKGCYVGQEIIARLATYGSVSKRLCGLVVEGEEIPQHGNQIVRDGIEVGRVTSGCYSPTLRHPIALGYLKRPFYEPGTAVETVHENQRLRAHIAALPFVP